MNLVFGVDDAPNITMLEQNSIGKQRSDLLAGNIAVKQFA